MKRHLCTFPISTNVLSTLYSCGFSNTDDLKAVPVADIVKVTQLKEKDILELLEMVSQSSASNLEKKYQTSAWDLLQQEKSTLPISTSSTEIDKMLRHGIMLGKVTEFCGTPGSGKTQLCLQLCVNVQIPEACHGMEKEAVFIDTEGGFSVDRLIQIAGSTIEHCQKSASDIKSFTLEKVLASVNYICCKSYTEILAVFNTMPEFLRAHPNVALIVLDGVSFHFRYGFDAGYAVRSKLLNRLAMLLLTLADDYKLAVVVTNHMTTKVNPDGTSVLIPAPGESWGYAMQVRVLLSCDQGKRKAHLIKSSWAPNGAVPFEITANGIRDYVEVLPFKAGTSADESDQKVKHN